jgi:magnesium transporter
MPASGKPAAHSGTSFSARLEVPVFSEEGDEASSSKALVRGYLYDADGHDQQIEIGDTLPPLSPRQLLWIDVGGGGPEVLEHLSRILDLPSPMRDVLKSRAARAQLSKSDGYIHVGLPSLHFTGAEEWRPAWTRFVWSSQILLTVHANEVDALEGFRAQDRGETQIGALTGGVLAAALLDWHLSSYFRAVEALERSVDRFDEHVLMRATREDLVQILVRLHRRVSRMRRLLSPQREIFHGLTRPDVAEELGEAAPYFAALGERFERAREALDHATDLVHGAFALHASRTAESVNDFLKALTFGTFMLGAMSVVAGLLGMNFDAQLFAAGERGFWSVVIALGAVGVLALIVARRRGWI